MRSLLNFAAGFVARHSLPLAAAAPCSSGIQPWGNRQRRGHPSRSVLARALRGRRGVDREAREAMMKDWQYLRLIGVIFLVGAASANSGWGGLFS